MRALACSLLLVAIGCAREGDHAPIVRHPDAGFGTPRRIPVDLGPAEESTPIPPAISGGTLHATADGTTLVASDPDRDRVWLIDVASYSVRGSVALSPGDEPGRIAEDARGRLHVVLRRAGEVAAIDPATATLISRTHVCAAPRGIAADRDRLHVACMSGRLVTLTSTGAVIVRQLAPDLRDVVVDGDAVWVSRFRAPEVIELRGGAERTHRIATVFRDFVDFEATVLWRMVRSPEGGVAVLHQRAGQVVLSTRGEGGYGSADQESTCASGPIESTVTLVDRSAMQVHFATLGHTVGAVDLSVTSNGPARYAAAVPGNAGSRSGVMTFVGGGLRCLSPAGDITPHDLEITAVVHLPDGRLAYQSRLPAGIAIAPQALLRFGAGELPHIGHAIFHRNSGAGIACFSCHPEGGDDGRTWTFPEGRRRTQSLRGGILATAPFHWDGAFGDVAGLMSEVFVKRMLGPELDRGRVEAVARWLDARPALVVSDDSESPAALRGRALFESSEVGCATCHVGAAMTNNTTVDVGTGGAFQVPSLRGLAARAPYLHDGAAPTIADRFGPKGGGDAHGRTNHLTRAQLEDLVAYLETL